jgi:hypothetical protein
VPRPVFPLHLRSRIVGPWLVKPLKRAAKALQGQVQRGNTCQ